MADLTALFVAVEELRRLEAAGASDARAARSAWRRFEEWCAAHGKCSLPAEPIDVVRYLAARAAAGVSPVQCRLDELYIRKVHLEQGLPSPGKYGPLDELVTRVLSGIVEARTTPLNQAEALTPEDLLVLLALDYRTAGGVRDQTILSVSHAAGVPVQHAWWGRPVAADDGRIVVVLPALPPAGRNRQRMAERVVELFPGDGGPLDAYANVAAWGRWAATCPVDAFGALPATGAGDPLTAGAGRWAANIRRRVEAFSASEVFDGDLDVLHRVDRRWPTKMQTDAAVVLLFAGALRGGEARHALVRHWRHRVFAAGVTLWIPRSRSDRQAHGAEIEIPYRLGGDAGIDPVAIVDRWIAAGGLGPDSPILANLHGVGGDLTLVPSDAAPLSHTALLRRLSRLSDDAGLERRLTGHSGRRGFATAANSAGIDLDRIKAHTRHKTTANLLLYIDRSDPVSRSRVVTDAVRCALDQD